MSLEERYKSEKSKWDEIARKNSEELEILEHGENFHRYARENSELPGISEFLGNLEGQHLLELGCGSGKMAVLLAKSGAKVTAFDLSPVSVVTARDMATANDTDIDFAVASGENLPFATDSFDVIFGKSILHHLIINLGRHDIYRVLKRGGMAVFVEPLGMNPVLTFARKYVPYHHKHPVGVDQPLTYEDIRAWTQEFRRVKFREVELLSMVERAFGWGTKFILLRKLDKFLLKYIPFLRRFCRYVVIYINK
jgi:ubiquinone/menaquinone biosynthesis C-methylase UbiE